MAGDEVESTEETAKKLFLFYRGSTYLMWRDGFNGAYEMCNVSRNQEVAWAKEKIEALMPLFRSALIADSAFHELVDFVIAARDNDILLELIATIVHNVDRLDTFTKIRLAEDLGRILQASEANQHKNVESERKGVKAMRLLADSASQEPITIAPYYQEIRHLTSVLTEEAIRKRLRRVNSLVKNWERSLRPRQNG